MLSVNYALSYWDVSTVRKSVRYVYMCGAMHREALAPVRALGTLNNKGFPMRYAREVNRDMSWDFPVC